MNAGTLQLDRRRRLLDAMAANALDALVLGRPANILFASGARQLWTAGARPFGPACIVVAATGRTHLLSVWDEGVPPDIPNEDLFPLSWNPTNIAASVHGIDGLLAARRVGTDSLSPGFARLLPDAELVDATIALRSARTTKTPDELACITTATSIAEAALDAMISALRPGVTERELLAVHAERIASLGAPTPPSERVAVASTDPLGPGDLVALDAGAMCLGYEGGVGRTWIAPPASPTPGQRELAGRCRAALDAVVAACRPGATGADVLAAWTTAGEPPPAGLLLHGVGLGMEQPLVGAQLGHAEVLQAETVVAVTARVDGFLERDLVHVHHDGPTVLSRFGRGPAAEERA